MHALLLSALLACNGSSSDIRPDEPTTDIVPPDACVDRASESFCEGDTVVTCDADGQVAQTSPCDISTEICSEGTCESCAPAIVAPAGDLAGLVVPVDGVEGPYDERRFLAQRLELDGRGQVSWTGPFALFHDGDGTELASGDVVDGPATLVIKATEGGTGEVTVAPVGACDAAESTIVPLTGVDGDMQLAGRALTGFPHFDAVNVISADSIVEVALDPAVWTDRAGYDVWVVPHRSPAQWAADPLLVNDALSPVSATAGADLASSVVTAWDVDLPTGPELLTEWDVVLDVDGNGQLDPGDLIDGFDAPGLYIGGDLAQPGPYTPISFELSESYWLTHRVYSPSETDLPNIDPMPLVVISHGNGHDYQWYDYLGNHLASWGYTVISHRNDTQPGPLTAADTTWQNTETFLANLATAGGGLLDGEVDPDTIVWIGHSRGGEGVVIAYNWVATGQVSPPSFDASDIKLVSSIAPTLFEPADARPLDVPYHILSGSADGDVTGGPETDLLMYWRMFQWGDGPHWATYVHGADHNDFNCCGANDGAWFTVGGPAPLIGRPRAQQVAKSYYLALLEGTLHGQTPLLEYLERAPENFRAFQSNVVMATFARPASADRVVIDDFQANPAPDLSSSGAAVSATVGNLVEGALDDPDGNLNWDGDAMNGMTWSHGGDPDAERGIVFDWTDADDGNYLAFEVPTDLRDMTGYRALSFRACQGTRHPATTTLAEMASMSVQLTDGQGNTSIIDHRVYGGLPVPYPRSGNGGGTGWVNEFQTIRIPLVHFTAGGTPLDLSDITEIRFIVGPSYGSATGRLGFDDLELIPEAP